MQIIAWRVSGRDRAGQEGAAGALKRWLGSLRMINLCLDPESQTYQQVLKDLEEKRAGKQKSG